MTSEFELERSPAARVLAEQGSKTILIPIAELERWVDRSAARYSV